MSISVLDPFQAIQAKKKPEVVEPLGGRVGFIDEKEQFLRVPDKTPSMPSQGSIPFKFDVLGEASQIAETAWNSLGGLTQDGGGAVKDLITEGLLGLEKTPVPNAFQKAFEGEDPSKLGPQIQQELEKKADAEEALAHNRRIIQSIEDLQRQKGENLFKTAQRLEIDPNSIAVSSLRKSSEKRIKGVIEIQKLGSESPFEMAKRRQNLHESDIYFEDLQQGWAQEEVEEAESEKSLAETQPVVNMNAVIEGGTGGAKTNISQTGGGAG